ncbi:MAG TPA: hypothetical protein VIM11_11115 [Tepidisphaeraceae bacterium]|jgi:hypothetical protein
MKPYVICHMCTTIDGKIIVKRWGKAPVGASGASLFEWTADQFGIGAWLVGTTTMKEFQGRQIPLKPAPHRIEPGDFVADPSWTAAAASPACSTSPAIRLPKPPQRSN